MAEGGPCARVQWSRSSRTPRPHGGALPSTCPPSCRGVRWGLSGQQRAASAWRGCTEGVTVLRPLLEAARRAGAGAQAAILALQRGCGDLLFCGTRLSAGCLGGQGKGYYEFGVCDFQYQNAPGATARPGEECFLLFGGRSGDTVASHSQVAPGREPCEVTGPGEPSAEQAGLGLRPGQSASRRTGPCGYGWAPLCQWGERGASGSSVSIPQGCCHLRGTRLCVICSGPNCCQESSLGWQPGTPPRCATGRSRSRWRSLWAERSAVNGAGGAREGQRGRPAAVYTGATARPFKQGRQR